ncbi:hypothetical protein K470DRAFT_260261 [Piedraia hortae CBS 480.64]|uniref:C2H2-type domain-containing protein n=1 Tax=Piedraia hortae CBS 480.64 TaxID=1314780 RepID=A0A6A7BRX7_9PEZI|nr:hypothetical protein K470DRAFT_260261 [Piedraia hortae CBS 480.64]
MTVTARGRYGCQWTVAGQTCGCNFVSAESLDQHVVAEHVARQPHQCCWLGCEKAISFGSRPKLTRHIHSHTGHKPYICSAPGCDRGFVTKEQLKNHETTHTRAKSHVCSICARGFAVRTALTSHMNVHRGMKPYVCDECGKAFADSSNLSKHKASHRRGLRASRARRISATTLSARSSEYHKPTPSIEPESSYCELPCFDSHCPDSVRLPCRSASPCVSAPCCDSACLQLTEPCVDQVCPAMEPPCLLSDCPEANIWKCHAQNCYWGSEVWDSPCYNSTSGHDWGHMREELHQDKSDQLNRFNEFIKETINEAMTAMPLEDHDC